MKEDLNLTLEVAIQHYDNLIKNGSKDLRESYKLFKSKLEEKKNMSGGLRYNKGKLPVNLVPASLNKSVAEVLKYGASKYEERNWERGMSWEIVLGCIERHLLEFKDSQASDLDAESGLPHMYHVACNVMMILEYMRTHPELDDRIKADHLKVSSVLKLKESQNIKTDLDKELITQL